MHPSQKAHVVGGGWWTCCMVHNTEKVERERGEVSKGKCHVRTCRNKIRTSFCAKLVLCCPDLLSLDGRRFECGDSEREEDEMPKVHSTVYGTSTGFYRRLVHTRPNFSKYIFLKKIM